MTPLCFHRSDRGQVILALYLGFVSNPVAIDYIPVDSGPLLFVVIANLCRNLLQIISCTQKQLSGEGSKPLSTGRGYTSATAVPLLKHGGSVLKCQIPRASPQLAVGPVHARRVLFLTAWLLDIREKRFSIHLTGG